MSTLLSNSVTRSAYDAWNNVLEVVAKARETLGDVEGAKELQAGIDQTAKEAMEKYPIDAPQTIEETDWGDASEVARLLASSTARQTAYIGATATASVAAAALSPYLGIGGTTAAALGGFLTSTALNTGEVVGEAREADKDTNFLTDLAAGAAMGGLDSLLPVAIARKFGLGSKQASELVENISDHVAAMFLGKTVTGGLVKGAAGEAITETLQEAIAAGYRSWYDENYKFLSEDTKSRLQNAFVLSLLPGGLAGGVTNALSKADPETTDGLITNNAKAAWVVGDDTTGFSYPQEPEGVFADVRNLKYEAPTALLHIPEDSLGPDWTQNKDSFIGWATEVASHVFGGNSAKLEVRVGEPDSNVLGSFDTRTTAKGLEVLIEISHNPRYDPRAAFHHELFHAIRALGLVSKTEWDIIKREIDQNKYLQKFDIHNRGWKYTEPKFWRDLYGYNEQDAKAAAQEAAYEEAAAELLATYWVESRKVDYANLKDPPPPALLQILDKLVRFFTGDRFKLLQTKLTETKDLESFFKATLRGELKDRQLPADQQSPSPFGPAATTRPPSSPTYTSKPPAFDFSNYRPDTTQPHMLGRVFIKNLKDRGLLGAVGDKGRQFAWWYHKFVWDLRQLAHMFPNFKPLQDYRESVQLMDTKVKEWLKKADTTRNEWAELGYARNLKVGEVMLDLRTLKFLKGVYYEVQDQATGKVVATVKTEAEAERLVKNNPDRSYRKIDDTAPRQPTKDEYNQILKAHGLLGDVEAQAVIDRIKADFREVLEDIQRTTIINLEKSGLTYDWLFLKGFGVNNPTQITTDVLTQIQSTGVPFDPLLWKVAETNALIENLKNQPYFPLARFGKYAVVVKKGGNTVYAEQFESETAATNRYNEFKRSPGLAAHVVTKLKVDEEFKAYQGIPPTLLDSIKDTLDLTEDQKQALRDLAYSYLPQTSFLQRLRRSDRTPGFSRDAIRAYATYFNTVSRFLGRLEYAGDMAKAIQEASPDPGAGGDQVWKSRIKDYMQWHYQNTILNPNGEWQIATSLSFLWHFFLNPSTAMLNATQPAMVSVPYFSSIFGLPAALKETTTSYGQLKGIFYGRYPSLTQEESIAFKIAEATVNDEGLALDLAASAESMSAFNLRRLAERTQLAKFQHFLGTLGTFMFSGVEKLNRRVVYMTAFRLAQKNLANPAVASLPQRFQQTYDKLVAPVRDGGYGLSASTAKAHIFAVEAVRDTMYDYSTWARPRVLHGFARAMLPFYNFIFKSMFFMRHMPGGMKYLAATMLLAGVSGLPGAEDLFAIARALAPKDFDPKLFLREILHEFDEDSKVFWPDLVLHGVTSQLPVSIGPRLGFGNIIPGAEGLADWVSGSGEFSEGMGRAAQDMGGAFFNIPLNILKAMTAGDAVELDRKIEMAAPTIIKKAFQARRYLADQASVGIGGETQVRFDLENPRDMAAIMGTFIGFTPQKVSEFYDKRRMQNHAATYWNARRTGLLAQYELAFRSKDPQQTKYVMSRINEYNNEVPFYPLKISTSTILESLKSRIKTDTRKELGLGPTKSQQEIYQKVERVYNK